MGHKVSVMATTVAMTALTVQVDCFVIPSSSLSDCAISNLEKDIAKLATVEPIKPTEGHFMKVDSLPSKASRRKSRNAFLPRKFALRRLKKEREVRRTNRRRSDAEDRVRSDAEDRVRSDDDDVVVKRKRKRRRKDDTEPETTADLRDWACATDVNTLRSMFGTNRNRFWGDLDNTTARRLYHTLLPRMLIGLYAQGLTTPDELAPLAFEARQAAKRYTRERSNVPGRVWATAYDGFRHLKTYGKWSGIGLSWEELWSKYEDQVLKEIEEELLLENEDVDVSTEVCLKILERSCMTNSKIDNILLNDRKRNVDEKNDGSDSGKELIALASKFENDVNNVLERHAKFQQERPLSARDFNFLRFLLSTKRLLLMQRNSKEDDVDHDLTTPVA